jgi:hypothetical protein
MLAASWGHTAAIELLVRASHVAVRTAADGPWRVFQGTNDLNRVLWYSPRLGSVRQVSKGAKVNLQTGDLDNMAALHVAVESHRSSCSLLAIASPSASRKRAQ